MRFAPVKAGVGGHGPLRWPTKRGDGQRRGRRRRVGPADRDRQVGAGRNGEVDPAAPLPLSYPYLDLLLVAARLRRTRGG